MTSGLPSSAMLIKAQTLSYFVIIAYKHLAKSLPVKGDNFTMLEFILPCKWSGLCPGWRLGFAAGTSVILSVVDKDCIPGLS